MARNEIEQVRFKAGTLLFEENEMSFHFFVIQEGEVEVFKSGHGGDVVLAVVTAGNSIGEFAMLDRQPRSASARALTEVVAVKVSPEAYNDLLEELPPWAVSVMRALVERLRFTNDIVRALQRSTSGVIESVDQQALESAEFSDSETRMSRIREAEGSVEHVDGEFDFSIYDSSAPMRDNANADSPPKK